MIATLNLNVATVVSLNVADQKLVVTDSPSAFQIKLDDGDTINIPAGRIGTIQRGDGQPLGRIQLISPGGGGAGTVAQVFYNDVYCLDIY